MRKGLLWTILLAMMLTLVMASGLVTVYADSEGPTLMLDGQVLETPDPPVIRNGRTLLPAKILFETMGGTVSWNNDLRETTIELNDTVVQLRIDNPVALVDGVEMTMDVPPTIINSRTYVPVNFAATNLGCEVEIRPSLEKTIRLAPRLLLPRVSMSHSKYLLPLALGSRPSRLPKLSPPMAAPCLYRSTLPPLQPRALA